MEDRATGQDIILAIIDNMLESLEPLYNITLAPGLYHVYLHTDDHEHLESVFTQIREQARMALDEELYKLNKTRITEDLPFIKKLFGKRRMRYQSAQGSWDFSFNKDVDEEIQKGEIVVDSQLALAPPRELGVGSKTKRVTTLRTGGESRTLRRTYAESGDQTPSMQVYARMTYEDNLGKQTYMMTKNQIKIGRGGISYLVDLELQTLPDVSREHARLRRDERTGQFYIQDLSTLGTTVNGQPIPSSIEIVDDEKVYKNVEVQLPLKARIGLAEVVFLDFEATS